MKILFLCGLFLITGCQTLPPKPPPPSVEGGGNADDCQAMCDRLQELKCDLAGGSTSDCLPSCRHAEEDGAITFCPKFVAQAKDCDDAKRLSQCDDSHALLNTAPTWTVDKVVVARAAGFPFGSQHVAALTGE